MLVSTLYPIGVAVALFLVSFAVWTFTSKRADLVVPAVFLATAATWLVTLATLSIKFPRMPIGQSEILLLVIGMTLILAGSAGHYANVMTTRWHREREAIRAARPSRHRLTSR
jgi:hypothetical protein